VSPMPAQGGFTYAGLSKNAEAIKDFKPLVTDFKLDFAAFVSAFANLASVLENMILLAENISLLAIVYLHVWCAVPINCACLQPRTRAPSAPRSHVCPRVLHRRIIYRIGLARGWW